MIFSLCGKLVGHFPVYELQYFLSSTEQQQSQLVGMMRWKHDHKTHCQNMSQWPYMQQVVCRMTHVEGVDRHKILCHWGLTGTQKSCCQRCMLVEFINLAELHVTLKGVNLAFQWEQPKCICSWILHVHISWCSTRSQERSEKSTNEMLTRCWLRTLDKIVKE